MRQAVKVVFYLPHPEIRQLPHIALIGEGMIELWGAPFGALQQTYGGDTINTAVYLARLAGSSLSVQYVSALGSDPVSAVLLSHWQREGVDTRHVLRDAARLPGLYWIQVDARGERSFSYWRSQSAARYWMQHPAYGSVRDALRSVDAIYLSGISLAVLPGEDRVRLIALMHELATSGVRIFFDSNYRPALWDRTEAVAAIDALLPAVSILLSTFEDEQRLWGDASVELAAKRLHGAGVPTVVLKVGAEGCWLSEGGSLAHIDVAPVPTVVDTTAAGDSFDAAFMAAFFAGHSMETCCRAGNALARVVIQYRGAIISAADTPMLASLLSVI